jgi:tetratricopeptide (TPR) repeat protein
MSLQIRRRLDDAVGEAAVLSNLAIAAELEADYDSARGLNEQALALRRDLGDRWALGVSHTNLGMIFLLQEQPREAREHFRETLRLSLEVGDPWMSAVAHHNLANAGRDLGDLPGAADEYAQALAAYRTFDDRWYLAYLLEDMALATSAAGQPLTTLRLAATADAMRDRLGAPRPASQELLLAGVLAKAKAECGAETSASAGELSDQELDGIVSGLLAHTDRDV